MTFGGWLGRCRVWAQRPWESGERDVRKAFETLARALPPLIEAYQRLVGLPPFGPARVATLSFLRDLLPVASFALAA
jgi:hypothetical protein